MADVTISQLTQITPNNNALLPYSQDGTTYSSAPSSLLVQSGNIGIGTFQPSKLLTVGTNTTPCAIKLGAYPNPDNLDNQETVFPGDALIYHSQGQGTVFSAANFSVRTGSAGSRALSLIINSSGNIGMGPSSPTAGMKLDIYGSTRIAGGLRLDYTGANPDPYIANIWTSGTLAANSSIVINMNGIAVNQPCAGIWLAFLQTDTGVFNRNGILYKASAMYMGGYMRTEGTNTFSTFTNMYTRDTSSLAITPPNLNDGQNFSFTNSYNTTCTYQIRTVPIMSNFRANT